MEGQDGSQVALAVLGDDAEAGQGTLLAGNVQGRVAAVVGQPRVSTGLEEPLDQMWLLGDHCQVEGSLEGEEGERSKCYLHEYFDFIHRLFLVLTKLLSR